MSEFEATRQDSAWGFWNPKTLIPLVALSIRLAAVALTFHGNDKVVSWEDVAIAKNLMEHKGYSVDNTWRNRMLYSFVEITNPMTEGYRATTFKPPLFPFIVVLLFTIFGFGNFLSIFVFNAVLSGWTAFLLYTAVEKQSRVVACLTAGAFALYPPF